MNAITAKPTKIGFELATRKVPITSITPLKAMRPTTKATQKYRQIVSQRSVPFRL